MPQPVASVPAAGPTYLSYNEGMYLDQLMALVDRSRWDAGCRAARKLLARHRNIGSFTSKELILLLGQTNGTNLSANTDNLFLHCSTTSLYILWTWRNTQTNPMLGL
ncbi:hypothetical protein M413DRAFT_112887 [Hebeloma cylindrosporum]|uniref:Uncharacterized protein n=1 Tax=Hebeloma cylindrosporum TaxID=76867 RepID=A0A0C3CZQ5_HEBCY|nr:hypothetical protein M413DRAFT_112887 [Hebeloma cylindrosporum h7]